MKESFAELFEESLEKIEMRPGSIVESTVVSIDGDVVTVDVGLKSEGVIPISQFQNENGELTVKVGDIVQVALDAVEDGFGETKLSREKAKRAEAWKELEVAFEKNEFIKGIISGKVKGGFTVDINSIRAFLPGSLVDVRPVRDTSHLENQELEFKVIKLDQKRNNIVVSRRAILEEENSVEKRDHLLESMDEGVELKGIIKNLTDYGAFVDLGGLDGLLHITDMAWKRIRHPSEIINVGDEVTVKVLKFDRERNRVSLGLKQLTKDPWSTIQNRFPEGGKVKGVVTNLTDYGCFVELEEGVEGLVHVSEMDWTNKTIHPSKVVTSGEEVEVVVLDIDEERRRISLGIKQCVKNPWEEFSNLYKKGDRISGSIKSITDFGIFIGLQGSIDGLVHLSDISWDDTGEEAVKQYKKGQTIESIILSIDPDRERISLGIKQLTEDPFMAYADTHAKGTIVSGKILSVTAKAANIDLAKGVIGVLKASEISSDRIEDATNVLAKDQTIEAKIVSVDRKNRVISVSIKAKDKGEEKENLKEHRRQESAAGKVKLGDLLRKKIEDSSNSDTSSSDDS